MKHINLSNIEALVFPGGEINVRLSKDDVYIMKGLKEVKIIASRIKSSEEVMKLLLLTDAIRNCNLSISISLEMDYVPYGRQDRVCNEGEALSIKVFANLINSQNYTSVTVFDPHSDVTPALIDRCIVRDPYYSAFLRMQDISSHITLVSPDAGANKKIKDLAICINNHTTFTNVEIVKCDKTRDLKTGKISGFEVYADSLKGKTCVIVDDICDGGGTFLGLAKELNKKGAKELHLIVSHGIFSKGLDELNKYFKTIQSIK